MSKHRIVSFIKSGVRIAACLAGIYAFWGHFFAMHAFALLLGAEILDVVEEFYELPAASVWPLPSNWQTGRYTK